MPSTAMEWAAKNASDIADNVEDVCTATHSLTPAFPVIPSATGSSVLVGTIAIVALLQKLAQLVGG